MKQFLITMAGVFAGLLVFLIGVPFVLIGLAVSATAPAPLPAKAVLELDLRNPLTDQAPHNPLLGLGRNSTSVMSIISTLRRAETDDRVKGLFIRLPEGAVEPGMADELRAERPALGRRLRLADEDDEVVPFLRVVPQEEPAARQATGCDQDRKSVV